MKLARAKKFLNVSDRNLFPVPSINSIIRVGRIPRTGIEGEFWIPIWKISIKYDDRQATAILRVIKRKLSSFAIAFENEDNYLILSDLALEESDIEAIQSVVTPENKRSN